MFKFCKHQLWECSRTLSDVAMGRRPADTVIRGARLVNVCTHEISTTPTSHRLRRIALVGDAAQPLHHVLAEAEAVCLFFNPHRITLNILYFVVLHYSKFALQYFAIQSMI